MNLKHTTGKVCLGIRGILMIFSMCMASRQSCPFMVITSHISLVMMTLGPMQHFMKILDIQEYYTKVGRMIYIK